MVTPRFGIFTQGVNTPATRSSSTTSPSTARRMPGRGARQLAAGARRRDGDAHVGAGPAGRRFSATATDADDDDELTYSWEFGDGSPVSDAQNPSHTYTEAGVYTAEVTVSDGEARTSQIGHRDRARAGRPETRRSARSCSPRRPGSGTTRSRPASRRSASSARANGFQVDATEDATVFRTRSCAVRRRRVPVDHGDPLNPASRRRSSATSVAAAATPASTRRRTPSTTGPGTASWWAATSATTRPARRARRPDRRPGPPATIGLTSRLDAGGRVVQLPLADLGLATTDYSPRSNPAIHVLATVDESTYDEHDGNTTDDDHPISWCQRYDGGRSWYTGMGHTQATFDEAGFRPPPARRPADGGRAWSRTRTAARPTRRRP